MAVVLVGTIVSDTAVVGDFSTLNSGANLSADDDTVTASGGMGDKMSNTTELLVSDNLTGGASGVYDFSSGGADEGDHFLLWVNTKTPLNGTTGIVVYIRNASGHFGRFNALPANFYKGGFVTRVCGFDKDFDTVSTWTVSGNPAQLDDVSALGAEFTTTTTIMGNFNNCQVDQMIVGTGLRVDVGTSGTPNTFETVYVQDEDTTFWGWWFRAAAKGKLYIGPVTGTTASWFVDIAFSVKFANENVNVGFYEFVMRGANTTVTWDLANIFAEDPSVARWSLTLDSAMGDTTGGFTDNNGVWSGVDIITLNANAALNGTTIVDGTSLLLTGATMDECAVIAANTANAVAFVVTDDLGDITDCSFDFSDGHAIEIDTAGTYTFSGNIFTGGYGGTPGSNLTPSSGSDDAMILNSSGGLVTIDVAGGGSTPSIRNTAVSTTQVNNNISVTFTGMKDDTEVRVYNNSTGAEIAGIENVTAGSVDDRSFVWSAAADLVVDYVLHNFDNSGVDYESIRVNAFTVPTSDTSIPIQQRLDRNSE